MSGHSKWHDIQEHKGKMDKKRAGSFSKLAKAITVAARAGGGDPSFNFQLRMTVDAAKAANMPKDNIERAIERGTGGAEGDLLEEVVYEGFGPAGSVMLIRAHTNNRNRTVADLKTLMGKNGGNLGNLGSVMWQFEKKGQIVTLPFPDASKKDEIELALIDAGADDLKMQSDSVEILCAPDKVAAVLDALKAEGLKEEHAEIGFLPKSPTTLSAEDEQKLKDLIGIIEDHEDVETVYTNAL